MKIETTAATVCTCALAEWLERGPAVVAAGRPTRVEITDRRPSGKGWWRFDPARAVTDPDDLPDALWLALEGGSVVDRRKYYPGDREARDALSAACLAWAAQAQAPGPVPRPARTWVGAFATWLANGPALMRSGGPPDRVKITDKEPGGYGQDFFWFWSDDQPGPNSSKTITKDVHAHLNYPQRWVAWEGAKDALSAACLAWAKEKARALDPEIPAPPPAEAPPEMGRPLVAGDVVRLRSGGPQMTVDREAAAGHRAFECVWFDRDGVPRRQAFSPTVLERATS